MQKGQCPECGNILSVNEILMKELINEKNILTIELSKLTDKISLYDLKSNIPEVVIIRTMRTKKNEKLTYINNIIKNLQHQIICEKSLYHTIFINYLINELTKYGYSKKQINELKRLSIIDHENKLKRVQKEIQRIHKMVDTILSNNTWCNNSGYYDPTAKIAIDSATRNKF